MKDVFIVSAKRTAFGTYGGKLVKHTATDLLEIANKAALFAANINPEIVDSVIVGNVCPVSSEECDYGIVNMILAQSIAFPSTCSWCSIL